MDWRKRRSVGLLTLACLLLVTYAGGCHWARPRHGVILRGDWSMELNRVPWLAHRADVHEECSVSECATGCVPVGEGGADGEFGSGGGCEGPTVAAPPADDLSGPVCRGGVCRRCRACRGLLGAGPVQPAVALSYRHSRFHPVPTRPVFLARPEDDAPAKTDLDALWERGLDVECLAPDPAPLPPKVEVIPTPEPDPYANWKAKPAKGDAARLRPVSWMFSVPDGRVAELPAESRGAGQAR